MILGNLRFFAINIQPLGIPEYIYVPWTVYVTIDKVSNTDTFHYYSLLFKPVTINIFDLSNWLIRILTKVCVIVLNLVEVWYFKRHDIRDCTPNWTQSVDVS